MKLAPRHLLLPTIVLMLVAAWDISDVVRGKSTPEGLIFTIPLLILSIVFAGMLLLYRRPEVSPAVPPPLDPAAVAQRKQSVWRIAKGAMTTVTLLVVAYTIVWALRSGTLWTPVIVGAFVLAVTWTVMVIVFRPKARR
jgi:hypothetical protein